LAEVEEPVRIPAVWLGLIFVVLLAAGCQSPQLESGVQDSTDAADDRAASATYTYFFSDVVNTSSPAKWTVTNTSGSKAWTLSNTYYSSPKAWVIGQNYWNNENDRLESLTFSVPANRSGIRFAFYSRWQIASGDTGLVQYRIGAGAWTTLATFTNASNPAYPNWTKYSYTLPDTGGSATNYQVRFTFTSNGSGTGWGFGVDSVTVYQTNVEPPTGVSATDGTFSDQIVVSWSNPSTGVSPATYKIHRASSQNGTYTEVGSVAFPGTSWSDASPLAGTNWYKVKGSRTGYPDSAFSAPDSGVLGTPEWRVVTVDSAGTTGKDASLELVNGRPGIAYHDTSDNAARYVWADDAYGSEWGVPVVIDSNGGGAFTAQAIDLHVVSGNPAVGMRVNPQEVTYVRAPTASGDTAWGAEVVPKTGTQISNMNLNIANVRPCLLYQDVGVEFVRANDGTGASWPATTVSVAAGGIRPRLAIVNGNPAALYEEGGLLKYERATNSSGSTWGAAVQAHSQGGRDSELLMVNGRPAIVYLTVSQEIYFKRASDSNGAGWPANGVLAATGATYLYENMSARVINGKVGIAFTRPDVLGNSKLYYVESTDANGTSWGAVQDVDVSTVLDAAYVSLADINGRPGIAYHDQRSSTLDLMFASYY
jgi:hypothetical protein